MRYSELDEHTKRLMFFRLTDVKDIGPWSRIMRTYTGTSSEDVGDAMGTSRSRVCAIERGQYMPKTNTVIELADAHGCDLWVVRRGIEFA